MNIVAYGGGTNSTAMLIECVVREIPIDLILFADTGGEKPHTYKYVEMFSKWLVKHKMPAIITVNSPNETLEGSCLRRNCLPSVAYGFKTCSQRFKAEPQAKFIRNWLPAKEEWKADRKITKLIGFDADEPQRAKEFEDDRYVNWYPLIDWGMGRDECIRLISAAGLPHCGKSSCFFCPSSKPSEIKELAATYPELAERALAMEAGAELTTVKGLARNWAWKDLLATDDMFSDEYICPINECSGCYDG